MNALSRYAKFIVAIVGAVGTWAATYYPNDPDVAKWVGLALALATCISVYAVPNQPPAGEPSNPNMSEQGHTDAQLLVLAVIAALVAAIAWHLIVR